MQRPLVLSKHFLSKHSRPIFNHTLTTNIVDHAIVSGVGSGTAGGAEDGGDLEHPTHGETSGSEVAGGVPDASGVEVEVEGGDDVHSVETADETESHDDYCCHDVHFPRPRRRVSPRLGEPLELYRHDELGVASTPRRFCSHHYGSLCY